MAFIIHDLNASIRMNMRECQDYWLLDCWETYKRFVWIISLVNLHGKKFIILFTNYVIIKPLPKNDCIVHGVVTTVFKKNFIESTGCPHVCMCMLVDIKSLVIISLWNLLWQLKKQPEWLWHLCCLSRSWVWVLQSQLSSDEYCKYFVQTTISIRPCLDKLCYNHKT